ncbi:hypothetical protein WN943_016627 [Citrus x changshan-huyou]
MALYANHFYRFFLPDGELRVGNIAGKIWLSVSHCACYTLYLVPGVEEPRRIILPVLSS